MSEGVVDILVNDIQALSPELLTFLLKDQTTGGNVFWATKNYADRGEGYQFSDPITIDAITGVNGNVIIPRAMKSRQLQQKRSREMAEVFTPSWVCNKQCNLIDDIWFDRKNVFNTEVDTSEGRHSWIPTEGKIQFPDGKTWQDYVKDNRLEITCGEAPYLASRYDAVTGVYLPIDMRIGLLDRKLRIVGENTKTSEEWLDGAKAALKSTYGYEWQGDNIVIARENLLFTILDFYRAKFDSDLPEQCLPEFANIISWNIWQMDGLKCVVPCSCHEEKVVLDTFFGEPKVTVTPCPGCKGKDVIKNIKKHNGIRCKIMDWEINEPIEFVSLCKV